MGVDISNEAFWKALSRAGKRGGLGGGDRKKAPAAPKLSRAEQLEIIRLMPEGTGARDSLPYTKAFDHLQAQFQKFTGRRLSKYEFWRVLSRIGKRSRKPKPIFDQMPLGGLAQSLADRVELLNPWWRAKPTKPIERYRRWAFYEVLDRIDAGLTPVVAIRGPRQVGKTTIQEQIIEQLLYLDGVRPDRIFRVAFDEIPGLGSFEQPITALVKWYEDNVLNDSINSLAKNGEDVYLFFDEVQNLRDWAPQLKTLADHVAAKVLVTGSSALRIAHGQDSLAGRISVVELGCLRVREIAGVRRIAQIREFTTAHEARRIAEVEYWIRLLKYSGEFASSIESSFAAFAEFGGYPICHKNGVTHRDQLADEIVETVVKRTLLHDLNVGPGKRTRDPNLLEETFRVVCRYAGQAPKVEAIQRQVESVLKSRVSIKQIRDALQFLADSMLIHQVQPLEMLLKRRGANPAKLCLCDHFVREAWLHEIVPLQPDELRQRDQAVSGVAGHIIENIIGYFLMGIPGLDVSWFPERGDEPEVDFILTIGSKRVPIEVKYRTGKPTRDDLRGLHSFCSKPHYEAEFGIVVTQDFSGRVDDRVLAVPARSLLTMR